KLTCLIVVSPVSHYYYFNGFSIPMILHFSLHYTASATIYTLSLHDALPILSEAASTSPRRMDGGRRSSRTTTWPCASATGRATRSEEHTSELQSRENLVCRLLLEKKNMR